MRLCVLIRSVQIEVGVARTCSALRSGQAKNEGPVKQLSVAPSTCIIYGEIAHLRSSARGERTFTLCGVRAEGSRVMLFLANFICYSLNASCFLRILILSKRPLLGKDTRTYVAPPLHAPNCLPNLAPHT